MILIMKICVDEQNFSKLSIIIKTKFEPSCQTEERLNYLSVFFMEIYIINIKSLSCEKMIKEYAALKVGNCRYVMQLT